MTTNTNSNSLYSVGWSCRHRHHHHHHRHRHCHGSLQHLQRKVRRPLHPRRPRGCRVCPAATARSRGTPRPSDGAGHRTPCRTRTSRLPLLQSATSEFKCQVSNAQSIVELQPQKSIWVATNRDYLELRCWDQMDE